MDRQRAAGRHVRGPALVVEARRLVAGLLERGVSRLSAIDLGQGMKSVTRQIAAEALGVPTADVYVDTADSDTWLSSGLSWMQARVLPT